MGRRGGQQAGMTQGRLHQVQGCRSQARNESFLGFRLRTPESGLPLNTDRRMKTATLEGGVLRTGIAPV